VTVLPDGARKLTGDTATPETGAPGAAEKLPTGAKPAPAGREAGREAASAGSASESILALNSLTRARCCATCCCNWSRVGGVPGCGGVCETGPGEFAFGVGSAGSAERTGAAAAGCAAGASGMCAGAGGAGGSGGGGGGGCIAAGCSH